jgi:hypothetical protein
MAKGQQRSNREVRKPKKEKAPATLLPTFGSQIKQAGKADFPRGKAKI